jgi:hypothetical protein
MLDDWHQAASVADESRYFGHFALNGVFMGTDATSAGPALSSGNGRSRNSSGSRCGALSLATGISIFRR